MPDDPSRPDDPSEEKAAVPTDSVPELSSNPLVVSNDSTRLALAEPATLAQGLRHLRDLIPGFVQLSPEEQRALTRAASLDPEFIEAGIRTGKAWDETKILIGLSGDELADLADEIRRWDETESEFRATTKASPPRIGSAGTASAKRS